MNGIKWSKIEKPGKHNTVIIVCTGPSLKNYDFTKLKEMGYIIAVNDAGKFLPFADAWFTLDPWGCGIRGAQFPAGFHGDMYAAVPEAFGLGSARNLAHRVEAHPQINYLHRIPFHSISAHQLTDYDYLHWGLNEDPGSINTGNSGYGALNMAYHMRPKNIILLGLDGTKGYFYDAGKVTRSLHHLPKIFSSAVPQLNAAGIEVINGSQFSTVSCFNRCNLNSVNKKLRELNG
jgi:hypothetical protein